MALGLLPQGRTLPAADWQRRHRVLLWLLWAHAAGLTIFALVRGNPLVHSALEGGLVGAFALAAVAGGRGQRFQAVAVALGLMTASAVLVHLWDGRTEAHFHFFVMVYVLALYEDWLPFGLSFGFVVLHHGGMGALGATDVYGAADAIAHPWWWALVHGFFILGADVVAVASWRLNEGTRARLDHQAVHDSLTRLPNRILFVDRLGVALARARRTDTVHAVLFVDLDHFKVVNDSLGHRAGDEVLLEVAARLDEVVRANDTVARFGGDEFTVLRRGPRLRGRRAEAGGPGRRRPLAARADRSRATSPWSARSSSRYARRRRPRRSCCATRTPRCTWPRSAAAAASRSSTARCASRSWSGWRSRTTCGSPSSAASCVTHYQPKVRIDTGTIVGVEALVRWAAPVRGLVPPNDFIGLAEETGLIIALGEWVLRDACEQAARWSGTPPTASRSRSRSTSRARQLEQADLVAVVERALDESGLDPARLCLVITESAVMRDLDDLGHDTAPAQGARPPARHRRLRRRLLLAL